MQTDGELPKVPVDPRLVVEIQQWAQSALGRPVNSSLLERMEIELNHHLGQFAEHGWRGLTALLHFHPLDQSRIELTFLRTQFGSIGRVWLVGDEEWENYA